MMVYHWMGHVQVCEVPQGRKRLVVKINKLALAAVRSCGCAMRAAAYFRAQGGTPTLAMMHA